VPKCLALLLPLLPTALTAQEPPTAKPSAPESLSSAFSGRAARRAAYKNSKVLHAVDTGIGWLKSHQEPAGYWDLKKFMQNDPKSDPCDGPGQPIYNIGVTSLALMAMLAQGDYLHHDSCHRGADWLARQFDKNGKLPHDIHDFIYRQALATAAMAEAAAVLRGPRYRAMAQRGIDYLESHRNPGAGWRYKARDGQSDTSVLSWCMSAYFAGGSIGLKIEAKTIGEAIGWLDSVTNYANGQTGYVQLGESSARKPGLHGTKFPSSKGHALAASGLHARMMAGMSPRNQLALRAADLLVDRAPVWEAGAIDYYYWLQGSISMEQLIGTPQHRKWRSALHKALLPNQRTDGSARGSWDPVGVWCEEGGRVYATTMSVLSLSSDYRFGSTHAMALIPKTPSFRRIANAWRKDRIGEAAKVLRKLSTHALTKREKAAKARLDWYIVVERTKAQNVLATLEKRWPSPVARVKRLQAMGDTYKGLPVGDELEAKLKSLLNNPAVKAELDANKALAKVQKAYDRALRGSNRPRRRTVGKRLEVIIMKYPGTAAGKLAVDMRKRVLKGT